jgi:hypothetical protein
VINQGSDAIQTVPLYQFLNLSLYIDSMVSSLLDWQEEMKVIEVLVVISEVDGDKKTRHNHNTVDSYALQDLAGDEGETESDIDQRSSSLPPPMMMMTTSASPLSSQTTTQSFGMNYVISGKLHTRYSLSPSLFLHTTSASTSVSTSVSTPRLVSHDMQVCFLRSGHYSVQAFVKIHYADPHYAEEDFGGCRNVWWTNETEIRLLAVEEEMDVRDQTSQ